MRAQICSHSVPQPSVRCSQQRFESVISVCGCRDRKNQMCIEMLRHRGADIRREESYLSRRTIGCAHRTSPLCHAKLECSPRQAKPRRSSVDCRCHRWLVRRVMQPLGPIMGLFERLLPRLRGDPARASDCRPLRRSWLHLSCVRISPRLVSHEVCGGSTTEDASAGALGDRTGGWIDRRWPNVERGDHANDSADETAVDLDLYE